MNQVQNCGMKVQLSTIYYPSYASGLLYAFLLFTESKKVKKRGTRKMKSKTQSSEDICLPEAEVVPTDNTNTLNLSAIIADIVSRPMSNPAKQRLLQPSGRFS